MKILLISPKDLYQLASPPLGLGYLISYAKLHNNNDIYFHDENSIPSEEINQKLNSILAYYGPDYVGITFPSSAIKRVIEIGKTIRSSKNGSSIKIFAGGYHPTSEPEATLRLLPFLDFIVSGEGEIAFSKIDKDFSLLNNVALLNNGKYFENELSFEQNIDQFPYPDRHIYNKKYFEPSYGAIAGIYGRVATIMTSRGCPYSCKFCSGKLIQKVVRFHSVEYVVEEIEHILSVVGSFDYLYFLDTMFLSKWSRTETLCNHLKKYKYKKYFKWAANASANVISSEKVKLMKEAGCFYLSFGFESASDRVLKLMNKKATAQDNQKALDICRKYSVLANSAFLFGIPGEEEDDLRKTCEFVRKNNIFSPGINVMKPLPGSPYYYEFIDNGILKKDIETWFKISSINIEDKIYNDCLDENIYKKYKELFYRNVYLKQKFNDIKINMLKKIRYGLERVLNVDTKKFNLLSDREYKQQTVTHWTKGACGTSYTEKEFLSKDYFEEIRNYRYKTHPWILDTINRFDIDGQKVLEIGYGAGTDHLSLASRGGVMYGIDITPKNREITSKLFEMQGYKSELIVGDAENLPYENNSFDFVYSFGVIHHSPDTNRIISEIYRVLKPGGRCYITVYHKNSIFFWWTVFFVYYLLNIGWKRRTLQQQLSLIEYPGDNENMVIRLYRRKEFEAMFHRFSNVKSYVKQLLPIDIAYISSFYRYKDKPTPFLTEVGNKLGWYVIVDAVK